MTNDEKKLIDQAEKILNMQVLKECVDELGEYVPAIAKMTMDMHKGLLEEGFNDRQAFEFAKEYTLKALFLSIEEK